MYGHWGGKGLDIEVSRMLLYKGEVQGAGLGATVKQTFDSDIIDGDIGGSRG